MLHDLFITPIAKISEFIYLTIYALIGNYGISLLLLSIFSSVCIYFLTKLFSLYPHREKQLQSILQPQIEKIKKESTGAERHYRISNLYKRYSYHPIKQLSSAVPIFIQLPFLLAAYFMLNNLDALKGVEFLLINDLSKPDGLLFNFNILPFIMTFVNVASAFLSRVFSNKQKGQALFIAFIFLVLLYNAPSALLIFWTMNNLIFLMRTVAPSNNQDKIIKESGKEISLTKFMKSILSFIRKHKIHIVLRLYFSYLVLFYLFQLFDSADGLVFRSYRKLLPMLGASTALWLLVFIDSLFHFKLTLKKIISLSMNLFLIFLVIAYFLNSYASIFELNPYLKDVFSFFSYLMLFNVFLTTLFSAKKKLHEEKIPFLFGFSFVLIFTMIPAVQHAITNSDYLSGQYYLYYFLSFLGFAFLSYGWAILFANRQIPKTKILSFAASFSFLFIALPSIRAQFAWNNRIDPEFWVLLASFLVLSSFVKSKNTIKKLFSGGIIFFLIFTASTIFASDDGTKRKTEISQIPDILSNIKFKETPNIYLFVYDGIPNERVFGIDQLPPKKWKEILNRYKFKLYKDTYSIGSASLSSMSNLLNFSNVTYDANDAREIYAGNSIINKVLRNNGYSTHLILKDYYTGAIIESNYKYIDEIYPPRDEWDADLNFMVVLLKGILQGEFKFDTVGLTANESDSIDTQEKKLELIEQNKSRSFIVNHYYMPGHTQNSGKLSEEDKIDWIKKLEVALEQMGKDFSHIRKFDPNSIVIAIGDHGPFLTGDGHDLRNFKKSDITEDMIWDRVGTMVAIRWPNPDKAKQFDKDLILNQDIFPAILSYMSDNNVYLTMKPDRTFKGYKINFKEGQLLE